MSDKPTAAELGEAYEAIQGRSDTPAIELYAELWDNSSNTTRLRAMFGLYRTK
ncbi:hypothetical protein ACBJ59_36695 [Nonomuraea sp. MTCD27]|uniref:hypothetical protein n=1 Tax=Nonomuraea sp. MTCD27 TaxID=1676747 RepID=UPI0035C061C5